MRRCEITDAIVLMPLATSVEILAETAVVSLEVVDGSGVCADSIGIGLDSVGVCAGFGTEFLEFALDSVDGSELCLDVIDLGVKALDLVAVGLESLDLGLDGLDLFVGFSDL